jgi:hypothetical protein
MHSSTISPYGDSFVLIGGENGTCHLGEIYKYDAEKDGWILLPAKLKEGKSNVIAMTVNEASLGLEDDDVA